MASDLYDVLADALDLSADEAKQALQSFLDDVTARVHAGESVTIGGVGTFSRQDDTVRFTPDPALAEAVNYRNADLEPLTIVEPSEPPPGPPEAPADEPMEPADAWPDADDAAGEPTDEPVDVVPDLSDEWTEDVTDEDDEIPAAEEPPAPASSPAAAAPNEGASRGQVIGLVASIALLLLAVGYVLMTQNVFTGSDPRPATESPPDTMMAAAAPADTAGQDTAASPPPPAPDQPSPPPAEPPSIDRATGGWTIVVASRTRPREAQNVLETYRQRFRGDAVPVDILTGETNGQLRYRVAVGQYPSRPAALTARQQLEDRLPTDAWPLEIQPNS